MFSTHKIKEIFCEELCLQVEMYTSIYFDGLQQMDNLTQDYS